MAKHARPPRVRGRWVLAGALTVALAAGAVAVERASDRGGPRARLRGVVAPPTTTATSVGTEPPAPTVPPPPAVEPGGMWVDPASSGHPWGTAVAGILTFRGNPTRSYYGRGPVPASPRIAWSYPGSAMCSTSVDRGETREWCGTGWTGQPAVFERDGRTWVVFGAYDRAIHFVDGETGRDILAPFPTGDLVKGSVTVDPDGFPLVYVGSRDGFYRVIAFDRARATELWRLDADAVSPVKWNDDWDGAGLVIDDHLVEGGENSQLHVVRLHRAYGADGLVTVDPELVFNTPGWDEELLQALGDEEVSIESSVAVAGSVVYFANSGGLVQGWDLAPLAEGGPPRRVFRFWMGDDVDASVVVDADGYLYVAAEVERATPRARQVGQLVKLDPRRSGDPIVWSVTDPAAAPAGFWATPALHRDVVYAATNGGELLAVDAATGAVRWRTALAGPTWQSPVVVDDVLVQGDCAGVLRGFDVSDTSAAPPERWQVRLGGCIESTPAVWRGRIYVGTRGGQVHALADDG